MYPTEFTYGIVMGFYGPNWSLETLQAYARFCRQYGHQFFIYAPKQDRLLREDWHRPFPDDHLQFLHDMRAAFRAEGVAFGVGLTPYGLNQATAENLKQLDVKIDALNALSLDILGIFFDDLQAEDIHSNLAQHQCQIAEYAFAKTNAPHSITVPTYYSHDSILTRLLGPAPKNYLSDFSQIDAKTHIFWTGQHILAPGFAQSEIESVADTLKRKPFLWDNYPVNDPSWMHDRLLLGPLTARPWQLSEWTQGHALNPMVQPHLSRVPLATIQDLYRERADYQPREAYLKHLHTICGTALAQIIDEHLVTLSVQGIQHLSPTRHAALITQVGATKNTPLQQELLAFLNTSSAPQKIAPT